MLVQGMAVGGGAALGALLRWRLALLFNTAFPPIPMGTLAANLVGGFLAGVCLEYFTRSAMPVELRLALTTGFLGGLTTFSAFSAETTALLLRREYLLSGAIIGLHLIGSLTMTLLGVYVVRALFSLRTA
jgi:fluoride exporter